MRAPTTDTGPNQQSRNAIGPLPKVKGNQASSNLPTEAINARRFGKVRTARSSTLIEDYVELIDDLLSATGNARPMDLARRLGVSHVAAIKTIWRLKREGLATGRPYRGIFLTTQGQKLAARVRARHRWLLMSC
jgi:DtxR family transcriptional regulator, manganese transport regulator